MATAMQSDTRTRPWRERASDEFLVGKAQAGDEDAREELVRRFDHMIRMKTRDYFLRGHDADDVAQIGWIGFLEAVRDWRPDGGAAFRTFASFCVTREMVTFVRDGHRRSRMTRALSLSASAYRDGRLELSETLPDDTAEQPGERIIGHADAVLQLRKISLSPYQKRVAQLHGDGLSYEEIAEVVGADVKSVDNALVKARGKAQGKVLTRRPSMTRIQQVTRLRKQGLRPCEIAQRLGIRQGTVHFYLIGQDCAPSVGT